MIDKSTRGYVFCKTKEEQNMMLDIFEMLEMRWRAGEKPRKFTPYHTPMNFHLDGDGHFGQVDIGCYIYISASELYNQWVSLKIKNANKITIAEEDWLEDDEEDDGWEWLF